MSELRSLRLLRQWELFRKADNLKRHHFAQQDAILGQVGKLEEFLRAAHSHLETEGVLMQACGEIIESLHRLHATAARERVERTAFSDRLARLMEVHDQDSRDQGGERARALEEAVVGRLTRLLDARDASARDAIGELARMVEHVVVERLARLLDEHRESLRTAGEAQARSVERLLMARLGELLERDGEMVRHAEELFTQNAEVPIVNRLARLLARHEEALRQDSEAHASRVEATLVARLDDLLVPLASRVASLLEGERDGRRQTDEAQARRIEDTLTARLEALLETHGQQLRQATEGVGRAVERTVVDGFTGLRAPRVIKTADYAAATPEAGLLAHLYSCLPARVAVDVGAHRGEISRGLLDAGYEVYAFEPFSPVYEKLREGLGGRPAFHPFPYAIAEVDGEADLHLVADPTAAWPDTDVTLLSSLMVHALPEGLLFGNSVRVHTRSLDSLARAKEIPKDLAVVKIDTEGYDLQVIRGMGDLQPAVVMAEFWDPAASLARTYTLNRLEDLVGEMRRRGFLWHLVVYRVDGSPDVAFFANHNHSVGQSWGNVLFFVDHDVFREALRWCAAVLPQTYFTA